MQDFFAVIGSNSSYFPRHDGQITKLKTSDILFWKGEYVLQMPEVSQILVQ